MWNNLARNFMSHNDDVIIKVDPNWGYVTNIFLSMLRRVILIVMNHMCV